MQLTTDISARDSARQELSLRIELLASVLRSVPQRHCPRCCGVHTPREGTQGPGLSATVFTQTAALYKLEDSGQEHMSIQTHTHTDIRAHTRTYAGFQDSLTLPKTRLRKSVKSASMSTERPMAGLASQQRQDGIQGHEPECSLSPERHFCACSVGRHEHHESRNTHVCARECSQHTHALMSCSRCVFLIDT